MNRAANAFRMAAQTLANSNTGLGGFYRRIRARLGSPKAITATAHKLARIFYRMWTTRRSYVDLGSEYYENRYKERVLRNIAKRAHELGYEAVLQPDRAVGCLGAILVSGDSTAASALAWAPPKRSPPPPINLPAYSIACGRLAMPISTWVRTTTRIVTKRGCSATLPRERENWDMMRYYSPLGSGLLRSSSIPPRAAGYIPWRNLRRARCRGRIAGTLIGSQDRLSTGAFCARLGAWFRVCFDYSIGDVTRTIPFRRLDEVILARADKRNAIPKEQAHEAHA